jgi:hypothetical protein
MTPSLPEHFPKDFMIEPSLKLMDIQSTDEGERFFFESSLNQSDLVLFYSNEMLKNHWTSQPLIGKGLLKQYIYQKEGRSIGLTFIPLTTGVQVEMIYQAVAVEESL